MIDIAREQVFPLAEAAKRKELPRRRNRKRPHVATIFRWASRGVRGCQLETIRVGGTLCTSLQAMQRFFDALTSMDRAETAPIGVPHPHPETITKQLDAEGL